MRKLLPVLIGLFFTVARVVAEPSVIVSHALSMHGTPKYKAGFTHFDYVNPEAPKAGRIVLHDIGTYDNFNRFAQRGLAAAGSETYFYDPLMVSSLDEPDSYYGLIARQVEYSTDFTWIIFHIDPAARFQDGSRITADDVRFSFNTFIEKGVPFLKQYYKPVTKVEVLDELRVKFTLASRDKEMLLSLAGTLILPKQFWQTRDFSEPITEVPLGSGQYTVVIYE